MSEQSLFAGGKKYAVIDWIAATCIIMCLMGEFINVKSYEIFVKYVPYVSTLVMLLFFFNHVNWVQAFKKREWSFILVCFGIVIATLNMFISHSGYGVIFNITSLFLILYLADKIELTDKIYYAISIICIFIFIVWWGKHENGYNTNMAAMILLILAVGTMPGLDCFMKKNNGEYIYCWYQILITFITVVLAWELRARGIMLGIIVFWLLCLLPQPIWNFKWLYQAATFILIAISVLLPMAYVGIWKNERIENFVWMDKNIFSGRQTVWDQFLTAFLKEPWTGIGSDITSKIPDAVFTELHNGLLHILVIYGVFTFLIIVILWLRVLNLARKNALKSLATKMNICLVVGLMFSTIFENYIVLPSFNLIFFLLLSRLFVGSKQAKEFEA